MRKFLTSSVSLLMVGCAFLGTIGMLPEWALGQGNNPPGVLYVTAAPVGSCGYSQIRIIRSTGVIYGCVAGGWSIIQTTGGSADWNTLTNKPATFTPSGHAASHGAAQSDALTLTKAQVGLANVDNTADSAKPVSTAQQTALDAKVPTTRTVNGQALSGNITLTKSDVGLGSVPNTDTTNASNISSGTLADARSNFGSASSIDAGHVHSKVRTPANAADALTADNNGVITITNTKICPNAITETGVAVTLAASHNGCRVIFTNDSDITLTVPAGLATNYVANVIQGGLGKIRFVPSSTTLKNPDGYTQTTGPGAKATVEYISANVYSLDGRLRLYQDVPPPGQTTRYLSQYNACNGGTANKTTEVQAALTALGNNEVLILDCTTPVYIRNVSKTGATGITIKQLDVNSGMKLITDGTWTPLNSQQMLRLENCTDCVVDSLFLDGNQKASRPILCHACLRTTIKNSTVANTGSGAYAAIGLSGGGSGGWGVDNIIENNTMYGTVPVLDGGGNFVDYGTRGIWAGEGNEYEVGGIIRNNTGTGMGHTFIVYSGSRGTITGNRGNALIGACFKHSLQVSGLAAATTYFQNNECHGAYTSWTEGVDRPVNGGAMQNGSCTGCTLADYNETLTITDNIFDAGEANAFVGGSYNIEFARNIVVNQWQNGILITQRTNRGNINIHHNIFKTTHAAPNPPSTTYGDIHFDSALYVNVDGAYTISNVTLDSNYFANGHYDIVALRTQHTSAVINGVTITNNSFVGTANAYSSQSPIGLTIAQDLGSLINVTQSGNCFTGVAGNNNISDSRGIIGNPASSGSCSNPTGLIMP